MNRAAQADDYSLTVTEDPDEGHALAATGGYLAVLTVGMGDKTVKGAFELEADAGATSIQAAVRQAIGRLEEATAYRHEQMSWVSSPTTTTSR